MLPLLHKICAKSPSELIMPRGRSNRSANPQLLLRSTNGLADDRQQVQQSQQSDVDPLPRNYSGVETTAICLAL